MYITYFTPRLSQPLFIGGLLEFFNSGESTKPDTGHAYAYAFFLILNMFVSIVLHQVSQSEMLHIGMAIRVACSSLIFKKVRLFHIIIFTYIYWLVFIL